MKNWENGVPPMNSLPVLQLNAENSLTNASNKFINRLIDAYTLAESRARKSMRYFFS